MSSGGGGLVEVYSRVASNSVRRVLPVLLILLLLQGEPFRLQEVDLRAELPLLPAQRPQPLQHLRLCALGDPGLQEGDAALRLLLLVLRDELVPVEGRRLALGPLLPQLSFQLLADEDKRSDCPGVNKINPHDGSNGWVRGPKSNQTYLKLLDGYAATA